MTMTSPPSALFSELRAVEGKVEGVLKLPTL